jgi:glycosyltransferase involved in cell wall biosynthesis
MTNSESDPLLKTIAILTPNLHQRDGIANHSIDLISGWLDADLCVQVFNLGRLGVEFEVELIGIESLKMYLSNNDVYDRKKNSDNIFQIMVVQYAISSYWFRILLLNSYLARKQNIKFHLLCHEPVREILILKGIGRCIYRHALTKSSKAFVFSAEAVSYLKPLTNKQVNKIALSVQKKNLSIGSGARYPNFLLMGFYLKDKGFERGVEAFVDAYVKTKVPMTLTIVVSVRQRFGSARIFAYRDRKNLSDFRKLVLTFQERFPGVIEWNDFLPAEALEKAIDRTDFLLLPYSVITNSLVAVHAKSRGLPVISSNLDPLIEAIGDDGIYVENGSIEKWSQVIQKIVLDQNWMSLRSTISKSLYGAPSIKFTQNYSRIVEVE